MQDRIPLAMIFIGGMVFIAHLFSAIYKKRMIPDVLMLLVIGLIIGPVLALVSPSDLGSFGPVFTTVTLVVILFESGTTLTVKTLSESWKSTMRLTVTGFVLTVLALATIMMVFLDYSFNSAIIFGAILGGTSSAVVIPLVSQLDVQTETRTSLILESALTDVLCIVIVLACVQGYQQGDFSVGKMLGSVISSFTFASFMGFAGALLWSRAIRYIRAIKYTIFTTPAFVFIIYGTAEFFGYNGAIASLVFGISMANIEMVKGFVFKRIMGGPGNKLNDNEMVFIRELTFILKTFFFVYIGTSIIFEDSYAIVNGFILTIVLFALRLLVAKFASPPSASVYDKSVISMLAPKGLAAAVLASIPEMVGIPEGTMIKNITYSVVLFTILASSVLIICNNKISKMQAFYALFFDQKTADLLRKKNVKCTCEVLPESNKEIEIEEVGANPIVETQEETSVENTAKTNEEEPEK